MIHKRVTLKNKPAMIEQGNVAFTCISVVGDDNCHI